ncbi:hypothetical protein GHT06_021177 [Daphnia sinensis]|uniref:Ig-like domain-containing protein n=1 Tax=Daphnia sinensis TaxID=1820382 RepID=A0AAD5KIR9_9CRUS|nr:hypothetical protein GHT06_021177 [Daphnia sinensis]
MAKACLYLFVLISIASIAQCQQVDDEEEQAVTMLPTDEIVVRLDQHLMLTCRINGPRVTRCLWEIDGAAPSNVLDMAIENRMHQSQRYGRCHIVMKVTQRDVGLWTCYMFTDDSPIPRNASTQVSLFHRTSSPSGLVTIIIVGLIILFSYVGGLALQKSCQFNNQKWKGVSKRATPTASTTLRSMQSQESSQCENSAYYDGDIEMSTSPNAAKHH